MTTILLVDDEELVREELGGLLEDEGYKVITAEDGEAGFQAYLTHRPNMVITDAKMPKREGLSLAKAILDDDPHVPITMITGHGNEAMAIAALRLGISDFIKKPVQITDLLAALDRMRGVADEHLLHAGSLPSSATLLKHSHFYMVENSISELPAFVTAVVREITTGLEPRRRDSLQLALREIMINAVEHGNLDVTYEEKTEATENGTLDHLVATRASQKGLRDRKVLVEVSRTSDEIIIVVKDQGNGFDWRSLPDPKDPSNILLAHGRGVLLAKLSVDELTFNEKGNEVTIVTYLDSPSEFGLDPA